jgi:hypothetical protein
MLTLWAQTDLLPADEFLLPAARPGGELRIDLPLAVLLRNPAVSQFAGIRRSVLIAWRGTRGAGILACLGIRADIHRSAGSGECGRGSLKRAPRTLNLRRYAKS